MGLGGRYELRGKLGAGTFGTVHEAFDRHMERRVAIKTVRRPPPGDTDAEEAYARVRSEAQAAGRLSQHRNIVVIHDFDEDAEATWIVMELVEGGSLKGLLDRGDRPPAAEAARITGEVLAALAYSHHHGVVHRDVKPANLLLTPDGRVKLADFGIARLENSTRTVLWTVLGAPAYMAPEQLRGEAVDHRADIWSAGVVLFELLTGEKPFTEPPAPSRVAGGVPRAFDAVVARALAKRPEDRFQSAAAFAEAVLAAAPRDTPSDPDPRRPLVPALVGFGAGALAAGAVAAALLLGPSAETRSAELQGAIAAAERGLGESRAALDEAERRRAELGQATAGAERWLQALREQATAAERQAAERGAARDEASARVAEATAAAAAAEGRLAELRGAAADMERELADHRAALQRTQSELARAAADRAAAQPALRAIEARLAELGRNERAAEQRVATLAQQALGEDQRRQGLQRQGAEAEQAVAERRAALDRARQEEQTVRGQLERARQEDQALRNQLGRARQEEQTLRKQLEAMEQRRQDLDRLLEARENPGEQRSPLQQPVPPRLQSAGEGGPAPPPPVESQRNGPAPPGAPREPDPNPGERRPPPARRTSPPPASPPVSTPPAPGEWRLYRQ